LFVEFLVETPLPLSIGVGGGDMESSFDVGVGWIVGFIVGWLVGFIVCWLDEYPARLNLQSQGIFPDIELGSRM
jgi:hypothetical protein